MKFLLLCLLIVFSLATASCRPIVRESASPLQMVGQAQPTVTPLPPTPTATPVIVDQELAAAGKAVYLKYYCGVCHALGAAGTAGVFGPSHEQVGAHASARIVDPAYTGKAATPADYLRESIVDPTAYIAPGATNSHTPMPPFVQIGEEDLNALVYFLLQQQ